MNIFRVLEEEEGGGAVSFDDDAISNSTTAETNLTAGFIEAELKEEEHVFDALSSIALNITIIGCLMIAYFVKKFRIYSLPESAGALMVGIIIGGIVRLTTDKTQLFEFVSFIDVNVCGHVLLSMENYLYDFILILLLCWVHPNLYLILNTVTRGILLLSATSDHF